MIVVLILTGLVVSLLCGGVAVWLAGGIRSKGRSPTP